MWWRNLVKESSVLTCLLPYYEKSRDRRCVQTAGRDFSTLSSQTLLSKD